MAPKKKIAVVGTGISGLTAARMLDRDHDVVVYEAADRIGGHTNTIPVDDPLGERWIDTGFIVHNDRNYPHFRALLEELGVSTRPAEMGMSIAGDGGRFEFANTRRGLFAQRSNLLRPRFWRLIADQLRFNREARSLAGREDAPTVGEFLRDGGYSRWFAERALGPEIAAVWSASAESIWDFPIGFLAEFLDNHGQLELRGRPQWQTIEGGSRTYVEALVGELAAEVRTSAPVRLVTRLGDGVEVVADGHAPERFNDVVIAAHADQALAMLAQPTAAERGVLGALRYQPNRAILHTDASLMPRRRRAWASWNFHLGASAAGPAALTYWMNHLQGLDCGRDYFVSLNCADRIDPDAVIEEIDYSHPVIDHASVAAQRRWGLVSGVDRIHYCGAYWRWGFHEDGCWSAIRACERLVAPAAVEAEPPSALEVAA